MNGKNNPLLCNTSPWMNNNSIWLGSTVTINRNLEKFKFPLKLAADKRKQILSLLSKDLLSVSSLEGASLLKAEEMPPLEKEFLAEHFLSNQSFNQAHTGEGFILDKSGEFLAALNLADHLTLQWIDCKEELEATWDRLVKIEMEIGKNLSYAFSSRFGFLTSDPMQCGTGLLVTTFLHLPALIYTHQLEEIIKKYNDESVGIKGLQGDPNDIIGDIVAFHNNYTLGVTEENIITSLRTFTTKLLVEEKSARSRLQNDQHADEIKDKVSRAYAILLHSYQIEAVEALNAISLLKLGLDLGWVVNTDHKVLNELLFNSRRAHLLCHCGEKLSQEAIPHKRAEFIHQALKGMQLTI